MSSHPSDIPPEEEGHEIPSEELPLRRDVDTGDIDVAAEPPQQPTAFHTTEVPPNSPSQQRQDRRKLVGAIFASSFCLLVIAAALIPALLFVVNESTDEANLDVLPETPKEASIALQFQPVQQEMNAAQQETFLDACDDFFRWQFPRFENIGTEVESQRLVEPDDSRQRQRQLQQQYILETVVQVQVDIPFVLRQTVFNATTLQRSVERESDLFLERLQETGDGYWSSVRQVTANLKSTGTVSTDAPSPAPPPIERDPNACNGLVNLCSMPVNEILFATMHNANSDRAATDVFPNHERGIVAGLREGIRGLNVDIGKCSDINDQPQLRLVHGQCSLGSTNPVRVLTQIQQFLTDNPREVLLLPVQINDDTGGTVQPQEVEQLFREAVDTQNKSLFERLYAHPRWNTSLPAVRHPWPTLQEMIDTDKRVIYMFYNGRVPCLDNPNCPQGFHDYFLYSMETDFSFNSVQEITADPQGACNVTRGGRGFRDFFGVNLFLELASSEAAAVLNQASFLQKHLQTCAEENGASPNLVSVDFWSTGDVIEFTNTYNAALASPTVAPTTAFPSVSPASGTDPSPAPTKVTSTPAPQQQAPVTTSPPTTSPTGAIPTLAPEASPVVTTTPTLAPIYVPTELPTEGGPSNAPVSAPTGMPEVVAPTKSPVRTSPPSWAPVQGSFEPTSTPVGTRRCNGLENLCGLPVTDVLFATMHNANSHASVVNFFANHDQSIVQGLEQGIRGINMDFGKCIVGGSPRLSLVHTTCLLGFTDPLDVLRDIHQFLTDNPNEVIIMPSQIDDDVEGKVFLSEIKSVMDRVFDDEGKSFSDRLYAHPGTTTPWPTLGELIDDDTRILFFVYNGEETCARLGASCPVGLHDWFVYAAETEFSFQDADAIQNDPVRACTITRGGRGTRDFFGINVFAQLPRREWAAILNAADFLAPHIDTCSAQNDLDPNLILVDFFSQGDVIDVVQSHNEGLIGPSPVPTASMTTMTPTQIPSVEPTVEPTAPLLDSVLQELYDLICPRLGSEGDCVELLDAATPRGKALQWLYDEDLLAFYTDEKKIRRYALATIYYGTNGDFWAQNSGWLSNVDECLWFSSGALTCNSNLEVVSLNLNANALAGALPYEVGFLTALTSLELKDNELLGAIPTSLGLLAALQSIDLSSNNFSAFPSELGRLTGLSTLALGDNRLVGSIFTEIGRLSALQQLQLGSNELSGTLPTDLSILTGLRLLDISSNRLAGELITELGVLTGLRTLNLGANAFSGPLPVQLGVLTDLMLLDLSSNGLDGVLPDSLGELVSLRDLALNTNEFSGSLLVLASLEALSMVRVDDNNFTGLIPAEVCALFDQSRPTFYVDCGEIAAPCATFCCVDGGDCSCRYEETDPVRCIQQ